MIKVFYKDDIIKRLGAIFTYGLSLNYSHKIMEERIANSPLVNDLENNEHDIETTLKSVIESTYHVKLMQKADITFKGLFFAETYFKLFLTLNKSFNYLFLYWPISRMVEKYDIYHEMDFSNLLTDFNLEVKKMVLLKKLSKEKKIKLSQISKLTGINKNTIDRYAKSDDYLYAASYSAIYKLSSLLKVKANLFVSSLDVYLDQTVYLGDKSNQDYRNYLGLYFANYFDNRIEESDYRYDSKKQFFVSNSGLKISISMLDDKIDGYIPIDNKTYLVIFMPTSTKKDVSVNEKLKSLNAYEIMLVYQDKVSFLKKGIIKEITSTVFKSMVVRAKTALI